MEQVFQQLASQRFPTCKPQKLPVRHPIGRILFELDLYQILINGQWFYHKKNYYSLNLHEELRNVKYFR